MLSVHDPRWGHRPEHPKSNDNRRPNGNQNDPDGPPELHELWRDFNERLNRLFGGKRGDGGGPFRPDARGIGLTALVAAGIVALIWLASGAFIVQDGQVGVVSTFGSYSHVTGPGFNWRWPAPVQSYELVNTAQTQNAEIGYRGTVRNKQPNEALMLTEDANVVDIQFSVQYRIKDPVAWVFNNRDQVETLRGAAESVMRQDVGKSKLEQVLYQGRAALAADARGQVQKLADRYRLGVEVSGVTLQSVQPPDQVAAAFEDVQKAQEDRNRERSEAQAYADDVIAQAKSRAARAVADAQAFRAKVVEDATGNAARFDQVVAEYAKAPAITRDRMYLDTMQEIYSSTSKVMIDAKTANNSIYLPLDGLLARSTANEAARGSRSGVMPPAAQPDAAQQAPALSSQPQPQQMTPAPAPAPQDNHEPTTRELRSRETGRGRESR
jgi:membrane protease subunit HflK